MNFIESHPFYNSVSLIALPRRSFHDFELEQLGKTKFNKKAMYWPEL